MEVKSKAEELEEAIAAANIALHHLEKSHDLLKSAGNWGLFDILGGGFIVSMIKRSKLSSVEEELRIVRTALSSFENEMKDIDRAYELDLMTDGFMDFMDVFFDNSFVDLFVQSKISHAKNEIQQVITHVKDQKSLLEGLLRQESKRNINE